MQSYTIIYTCIQLYILVQNYTTITDYVSVKRRHIRDSGDFDTGIEEQTISGRGGERVHEAPPP